MRIYKSDAYASLETHMFAIVQVRKDDSMQDLCFCNRESADRFVEFVKVYIRESGAGNGYGAYWIFDDAVGMYERPPAGAVKELESERIQTMLESILQARTAEDRPSLSVDLLIGTQDGAISLKIGELPPAQRPTAGDMCRVIGKDLNEVERTLGDGRVVRDLGDTLKVVSSWDTERDGRVSPNAKYLVVRTKNVMKINDWKAGRRG